MKRFRIGVFLNEEIRSDDGGAFSYSQSLLAAIDERVFSEQLDVVVVL